MQKIIALTPSFSIVLTAAWVYSILRALYCSLAHATLVRACGLWTAAVVAGFWLLWAGIAFAATSAPLVLDDKNPLN
jgi:hypothetical protein